MLKEPVDVSLTSHQALTIARDALIETAKGDEAKIEAATMLHMILLQRGCEDLDPAVRDGRLTTFMDVVIFG